MPKRLLGPLCKVMRTATVRGLGAPRYKAVLVMVLACHHIRRVNYRDYKGRLPKRVHCPLCGAQDYGNNQS